MRVNAQIDSTGWRTAMDRVQARVDQATPRAAEEAAGVVARRARDNSKGRPGPNYISGDHWRGIRARPPRRLSNGRWEAMAVATARHSAALERGSRRWKSGVRFPYMGPAVRWAKAGPIRRVFISHWSQR